MKKNILAFVFALFLFGGLNALPVLAGSDTVLWDGMANNVQAATALGNRDPRMIAADIINIILGFLGILSLILILYAGFKWMTASGNEDQISGAKKILVAAVIGLIIILSAYGLASFVLDAVFRATTS